MLNVFDLLGSIDQGFHGMITNRLIQFSQYRLVSFEKRDSRILYDNQIYIAVTSLLAARERPEEDCFSDGIAPKNRVEPFLKMLDFFPVSLHGGVRISRKLCRYSIV